MINFTVICTEDCYTHDYDNIETNEIDQLATSTKLCLVKRLYRIDLIHEALGDLTSPFQSVETLSLMNSSIGQYNDTFSVIFRINILTNRIEITTFD